MHLLHQSISLWGFIVFNTGLISKSFSKGVKFRLKQYPFVKHDFAWMQVSAKACVIKQPDNPIRLFIYVLIITVCNLIKVINQYLDNFKPSCGGVDHRDAGETNIILNDRSPPAAVVL